MTQDGENAQARSYEGWAREQAKVRPLDDYLYSEEVVRFELEVDDLIVLAPDTRLESAPSARLSSASWTSPIAVPLPREDVARAVTQLQHPTTLSELRQLLGDARAQEFVASTLGRVSFAPAAVYELEQRISGIEITRFPGSPYEISRSYWRNMADVREEFLSSLERLTAPGELLRLLRRLHQVALLGSRGDSFYLPASPIAARGVNPGVLLESELVFGSGASGLVIEQGARVNASLLGSRHYHELMAESLGDILGAADEREHEAGKWGRIVFARAGADTEPKSWFCPPRPLTEEHLTALWASLQSTLAEPGRTAAGRLRLFDSLADFQQKFIQVHPFRCANQSLAMNLVNAVLKRLSGNGMPHLILDHFALRLAPAAYRELFRRAVDHYTHPGMGIVDRYRTLRLERGRSFDLLRRLASSAGLEASRKLLEIEPDTERALLLRP